MRSEAAISSPLSRAKDAAAPMEPHSSPTGCPWIAPTSALVSAHAKPTIAPVWARTIAALTAKKPREAVA